jgi:hypothetical protein
MANQTQPNYSLRVLEHMAEFFYSKFRHKSRSRVLLIDLKNYLTSRLFKLILKSGEPLFWGAFIGHEYGMPEGRRRRGALKQL